MINSCTNNSHKISFSSRNKLIRDADKVCRQVNISLPVFSSTRLDRFRTIKSSQKMRDYLNSLEDKIIRFRIFYINNKTNTLINMINGMKLTKTGNCGEIAEATRAALKMNNYNDVSTFALYAYNPYTQKIRDLDHTVTAINFSIPKNFDIGKETSIVYKDLLKPDKKAIIVDSWAGFVEYAKDCIIRYKTNVQLSAKIGKNDKLMFLPLVPFELGEKELSYLKSKYPDLILKKDSASVDTKIIKSIENTKNFKKLNNIYMNLAKNDEYVDSFLYKNPSKVKKVVFDGFNNIRRIIENMVK